MKTNSPIVLVLSADKNYLPGLYFTLTSTLVYTNTTKLIKIYILDIGDLDKSNKEDLEKVLLRFNQNISITWKELRFESLNKSVKKLGNTYATYSRLFIPQLINEPKAIWLDVDLLVLHDIEELWNIELEDYHFAAVKNLRPLSYDISNYSKFGIPKEADSYCSGVLLINNQLLKKIDHTKKTVSFLKEEHGNHKRHDQSAINVVSFGKIKTISNEWNQYSVLTKSIEEELALLENKKYIYHFFMNPKPWGVYRNSFHAEILYKIAEIINLNLKELKTIKSTIAKLRYQFPNIFKIYNIIFFKLGLKQGDYKKILRDTDDLIKGKISRKKNKKRKRIILEKIGQAYQSKIDANKK